MRMISSVQNPAIRALRALQQGKARQAAGCFLVEGRKLVSEALRDAQVVTVLMDEAKADQYTPLLSDVRDVIAVPERILKSVCETQTPQGIVASVRFPAPLDLDMAHGCVLVLDGVQDPGNVGTILRTAEAAGFSSALLSSSCADPFAPKTVRATMGSVLRLPLWRGTLPEALREIKRRRFMLIGSSLNGAPFYEAVHSFSPPLALVIGSEGNGIAPQIASLMDQSVALPMYGKAESLNAAVAAGLLMYGIVAQSGRLTQP